MVKWFMKIGKCQWWKIDSFFILQARGISLKFTSFDSVIVMATRTILSNAYATKGLRSYYIPIGFLGPVKSK
ncbi:hypothetical protein EYC84_003322 [Monilinia fructicola]|uniref:Uncharacterized protein n=1 Tax=Monilinia fructicola TaxID=38448 RepID=A0A5M9JVN2_MONFR|nr:hypothetical protein EYC84_003322 [Monilinia fructicola]